MIIMTVCSRCGKAAVIFVRYSGAHLCRRHFLEFFRKRVRKELRRQFELRAVGKIAVAISGGKDSAAALTTLVETFGKLRNLTISAISVDEGIEGYRPGSLEAAGNLCERLGVHHEIVSFWETYGITLDEAAAADGPLGPCSYCGVWRKKCLNTVARKMEADVLATGHNLDDMAQSIAMNIFRGDVKKLVRMGPHRQTRPGLVPRIMPLRAIPEKETYLFCLLEGLPFEDLECPYAVTAHRGLYRDMVDALENNTPGTRHSILGSRDEIYAALLDRYPRVELARCSICGEPTSRSVCKACEMEQDMRKRLGGGYRERGEDCRGKQGEDRRDKGRATVRKERWTE